MPSGGRSCTRPTKPNSYIDTPCELPLNQRQTHVNSRTCNFNDINTLTAEASHCKRSKRVQLVPYHYQSTKTEGYLGASSYWDRYLSSEMNPRLSASHRASTSLTPVPRDEGIPGLGLISKSPTSRLLMGKLHNITNGVSENRHQSTVEASCVRHRHQL